MREYPEYPGFPYPVQVVFDFDGTLAEGDWPDRTIGKPIPEGVAMLRHYASQGFSICIYTARPTSDEAAIWEWTKTYDVPCDKVRCDKPVGWLYVDDRAERFER